MTDNYRWEQQSGGLYLATGKFDTKNLDHRTEAVNMLRASVGTVAGVHGAAFRENGMRDNIRALYNGDIRLDFFLAKWEVCVSKPVYLGAALSWDTVGITPDGKVARAIYTEDVCLLTGKLRELVRLKPDGKDFPEASLAESFERLDRKANPDSWFKYGEVNPDNLRMVRSQERNGGMWGSGDNSGILEMNGLPEGLLNKWPMPVQVIGLRKDGKFDDRNFIVQWQTNAHDIRLIATRGRATAMGHPRADIRPWHDGKLPDPRILSCVMASLLRAIKQESEIRGWGNDAPQQPASPVIPIAATRPEIYRALYGACVDELSVNNCNFNAFGQPMPDAHIYVIHDQAMLDIFKSLGATPRIFGNKVMMPGVNVLKVG